MISRTAKSALCLASHGGLRLALNALLVSRLPLCIRAYKNVYEALSIRVVVHLGWRTDEDVSVFGGRCRLGRDVHAEAQPRRHGN